MFQKPFRVKTQTAIKGSDRKKLRGEIGRLYPNFPPEQMNDIVPSKEEMTVAKICTQSGENIVVYCLQKTPIFFERDKTVFPTVYTLWSFPELLPTFTTWPPVFQKLAGGADLMLPGLVVGGEISPSTFSSFQKGDMCAVNLLGNRAPVAVGVTAMSGSDMFHSGMRGKGVHPVHMFGDELWAFGDKSSPPDLGIDRMPVITDGDSEERDRSPQKETDSEMDLTSAVSEIEDISQNSEIENLQHGVELPEMDELTLNEQSGNMERPDHSPNTVSCSNEENPKDADEMLYFCFKCALKSSIRKADLPMLTSAFFRSHMVPYCPANKTLDVKKSSFKKLSKFLQSMEGRGFIQVKELSKGVDSIVEIDKDHLELRNFEVPERGEETQGASASATKEYHPAEVTEMFAVSSSLLPIFKDIGYSKGSALTVADVRNVVKEYAKANNLLPEGQKGHVQLDPVLAHIVLNKGEGDITMMSWQDLLPRITGKMQIVHQLTYPGEPPVIRKGKVEPIKLDVVQRASNKKVTIVDNLEMFGIDPHEFAHTVQVAMACSSSVNPHPQKKRGMQVLVQGNQVGFIGNLLLDQYKISRNFIQGLEKAPKSKRR